MIVVISHPKDPHAGRVIDLLKADGRDVLLMDLSALPARATLSIDYQAPREASLTYRFEDRRWELGSASAVWWRRPQVPDLATIGDPEVHAFTHNEWTEAINGLWQLIDGRWMNPPARDEVAARKALQLRVASELGFRIPRTLMTSDPDAARAFVEAQGLGRTIFKTFSCTHAIWRETRLVREAELASIDTVRLGPVIFQEYIAGSADLRVTVVGRRIFPAMIDSRKTDYPVDFRMSLGQSHTEATELPPEVQTRLLALMDRLGLVYGAIDLRRTPEGEYVFLEVNTAGEFLFVEERTGLPISRAIADWLATPA